MIYQKFWSMFYKVGIKIFKHNHSLIGEYRAKGIEIDSLVLTESPGKLSLAILTHII